MGVEYPFAFDNAASVKINTERAGFVNPWYGVPSRLLTGTDGDGLPLGVFLEETAGIVLHGTVLGE